MTNLEQKISLPEFTSEFTEEEVDRMLKPYLLRLVKRIESGEEKTYSWEEAKKELSSI